MNYWPSRRHHSSTALGSPGTNYSYRLRSWNSAGYSPYSNLGAITTPPIPALGFALSGGALMLTWPAWATNFSLYSTTNLAPPAVWSAVTNTVTNVGASFTVTLPIGPDHWFFRLRGP